MKKLPRLKSDKDAEAFVARADLTEFDLSTMRKVQFEFEEEIGRAYDAMKADPKRGIPATKVFAAIRARHAAKLKAAKK